jgi:hypothetical protein
MDRFLRGATPIVLLALAGLAWFERWLPGHERLVEHFGPDGVLRFVTGLLCVYVVLLVIERQRMQRDFKEVLDAFRTFHSEARGTRSDAVAQREAIEILIGALASSDPVVRESSAQHLRRLTGQDLGPDAAAWRRWLATQSNAPRI